MLCICFMFAAARQSPPNRDVSTPWALQQRKTGKRRDSKVWRSKTLQERRRNAEGTATEDHKEPGTKRDEYNDMLRDVTKFTLHNVQLLRVSETPRTTI